MSRMAATKKAARKNFFSNTHSTELSVQLANEYLRQAGVASPTSERLSTDEQVKPIREVVRKATRRSAGRFRGLKRLARK